MSSRSQWWTRFPHFNPGRCAQTWKVDSLKNDAFVLLTQNERGQKEWHLKDADLAEPKVVNPARSTMWQDIVKQLLQT